MSLGLLVASENANTHTDRQDSCFISIDFPFDKEDGHTLIMVDAHMPDNRNPGTDIAVVVGAKEVLACIWWILAFLCALCAFQQLAL